MGSNDEAYKYRWWGSRIRDTFRPISIERMMAYFMVVPEPGLLLLILQRVHIKPAATLPLHDHQTNHSE